MNPATYTNKLHMYNNVRFNAVPTSYRTYTIDLLIKSTFDITILESRFVLVLDKIHINPLAEGVLRGLVPVDLIAVYVG